MNDTVTPWPVLRLQLIAHYSQIADCERDELNRPAHEQYARNQIARLERESDVTLAEMLEGAVA